MKTTSSNERKELGKITSFKLGYGGYQDAMFGVSIGLGGSSWGVGDFKGAWSLDITVDKYTKWTEKDRDSEFAKAMRFINETLKKAHKTDIGQLVGVPVEVTFDGNCLKSWRILEEVL